MQSKLSGGSAPEKPGANQSVKYDFQRLRMDLRVRTDLSAINNNYQGQFSSYLSMVIVFKRPESRGQSAVQSTLSARRLIENRIVERLGHH
jgi:hypothetical protein